MDKTEFLNYLNKKYTSNSSNSRLCRLVKVEKLLVKDPDEIVAENDVSSIWSDPFPVDPVAVPRPNISVPPQIMRPNRYY